MAIDKIQLNKEIIKVLDSIYDPEIPVSVYDLGLIYDVSIDDDENVNITMTLTTPHCPFAQKLPKMVEKEVMNIEKVNAVNVTVTFEPAWNQNMLTDKARKKLGL